MGTGKKNYVAPEWLTVDFLQDVLKEHFKEEQLTVSDLVVKSANVGDVAAGFASEMHRANFNLLRGDLKSKFSVFVKDHPKGQTGAIALRSKLFKREILTYKEVLPRVQALLESIGDKTKLAPTCYYTTESPEPFLILEDMQQSGFENFERGRLLNLDYILLSIEKLAKLHACSAVIGQDNPEVLEFFNEAPISRNPDRRDFLSFFPVNIRCAAEEIAHWKGFEEITEKMFKLAENVLQSAVEMYETQQQGFRVFNMADIWINNLMFHINNETKEPDDVIAVSKLLKQHHNPTSLLNIITTTL